MDVLKVNALIVGGGVAGLWTLFRLRQAGYSGILLESRALGDGQTISSQGILHSGLKYSLQGLLTPSAREAKEMPLLWRRCLEGQTAPDLSATEVLSHSFFLWGTDSTASRFGLLGAKLGLQVTPREVPPAEVPSILSGLKGTIYQVQEQVISPSSFLENLAGCCGEGILKIDPALLEWSPPAGHSPCQVIIPKPECETQRISVEADRVILTAGQGNQPLRASLGLASGKMQTRPLHMVLLRGPSLPEFHGHCIDGAKTRISITSGKTSSGETVWQIGGQLAEDGVAWDHLTLIDKAHSELQIVLPNFDTSGLRWSTYRIDRAEGATLTGGRPESFRMLREGTVITAWPTKLVLAPQLAEAIVEEMKGVAPRVSIGMDMLKGWPRPSVAHPPWERADEWTPFENSSVTRSVA